MSEVAFFVKDVVGPKGCASIVMAEQGSNIEEGATTTRPTSTRTPRPMPSGSTIPSSTRTTRCAKPDELLRMDDEPGHDELCEREQLFLLNAIRKNLDLEDHMNDAVNSLRVVLAADESIKNKKVVTLR